MLDVVSDPKTTYLDPQVMTEMIIHTMGSFSGIGVRITEIDGQVIVADVFGGAPAEQAGIQEDDRIVIVDGQEIEGIEEAVSLLRGQSDTEATVKVERRGKDELLTFKVTRGDIEAETVYGKEIAPGVGYIQITSFDAYTACDFSASLAELEKAGLEGLILDLRNNPGGLMDEAIAVSQLIVPSGKIVSVVGRDDEKLETFYSEAAPKSYDIVVLVNNMSASAAEILAGALQDSGAAVLVGTQTYGKATVQNLNKFDDGSGMRYTVAVYRTPSGRDLHKEGLLPDYHVEMHAAYYLMNRALPTALDGDKDAFSTEEMSMLQSMLSFFGYDLAITGELDRDTRDALISFAEYNNIEHDDWIQVRRRLREVLRDAGMETDPQLDYALELIVSGELR